MFWHLYKTNQGKYDLDPQNFVTSIKFMYEDGVCLPFGPYMYVRGW
jgi:hypothetical protein